MALYKKNFIVIENDKVIQNGLCQQMKIEGNSIEVVDSAVCGLHIVYKNSTMDLFITINPNAVVEIMETYEGECKFNKEIIVNSHAKLDKITLNEAKNTEISEKATIMCGAEINASFAQTSEGNVNDKVVYLLAQEGAKANVINTAIASKQENKKVTVKVIHEAKNTTGNIENFGVSKESGYLVFNGYGQILKGMKGSKSTQTQKIMIFDRYSKGEANPYLLIDENDVIASHAAGIGQMDKEHLFYLESRGIPKQEARKIIALGYVMPVAMKIENEDLRKEFISRIEKGVI